MSTQLRVGIQGWGSEGDIRPLIALAGRLRREGHAPQLVVSPIDGAEYQPLCRRLDVPLRVVPEKMRFSLDRLTRDANSSDLSRLSRAVMDLGFFPYLDAMFAAAIELSSSSDIMVGGSVSWYVKAAALKTGIPFVNVDFYPGMVPSRQVPPAGLGDWGWFNSVRWMALRVLFDLAFRKAPARFFAEKGLPPIRHAIPDALFSEQLNLHAASPAFCPPAPDWPAIHQVCGEFVLPEEHDAWEPSPSLRAFLEGGERPVLLSLGSMEHMAPERARSILLGAARQSGVRAIIQTKREGHDEGQDGNLYFVSWVPHRAVVPHCAAVVHHGGAGTTHAVLRAGRPAVVLPFIPEQTLWARRLEQVGAADRFISFWKATPERVAARIRQAVESDSLRLAAASLAAAMQKEDGTGAAVRLLEALSTSQVDAGSSVRDTP
jgi:UDP:flavonoid glycosyltransferase YjiC (YdhE family)